MIVHTKPGIQSQPFSNVLTKIHISGNFILVFVNQIIASTLSFACHIISPCLTAITEPVESECDTVPFEELRALEQRHAHHVVA